MSRYSKWNFTLIGKPNYSSTYCYYGGGVIDKLSEIYTVASLRSESLNKIPLIITTEKAWW